MAQARTRSSFVDDQTTGPRPSQRSLPTNPVHRVQYCYSTSARIETLVVKTPSRLPGVTDARRCAPPSLGPFDGEMNHMWPCSTWYSKDLGYVVSIACTAPFFSNRVVIITTLSKQKTKTTVSMQHRRWTSLLQAFR